MWNPKQLVLINVGPHVNTTYAFSKGEAVLVCGLNLDDQGQERNGSGKTFLVDGVAIAISGDSMRKVKAAELVRNGEKCCEIHFSLNNEVLKQTLEIKRIIYSGTKTSELHILLNGEVPAKLSTSSKAGVDVKEGNKFIFDTLGITREDFFAYYVISKEKFVPFFTASDKVKKEIISRFSGADLVDNTDVLVQIDIDKVAKEITTIEGQIISVNSKIEVHQQSLEELEKQDIEADKKTSIISLSNQIVQATTEIEINEIEIELRNEVLTKWTDTTLPKLLAIDTTSEHTRLAAEATSIKTKISALRTEYNNVGVAFSTEKTELEVSKKKIDQEKQEKEQELKDINESLAEIDKFLMGEIVCPACSNHFVVNGELDLKESKSLKLDFEQEIIALNKEIASYKQKYLDHEAKRSEFNLKIKQEEERIDAKIEVHKKMLDSNSKQILANNAVVNRVKKIIQQCNSNIVWIEQQIKSLKQTNVGLQTNIDNYKKQIEQLNKPQEGDPKKDIQDKIDVLSEQVRKLNEQLADKIIEKGKVEEWLFIFKSFKSHLANKSISAIEGFCNLYLGRMKSNISIVVDGYKTVQKKLKEEISCEIMKDGISEGSYGKMSAGERGRVDIATVAAIQNLINLNAPGGGLNLLCVDEAMDSIDSLGLQSIINALQGLSLTVLLVTQNVVNGVDEHLVTIQKKNGISTIK